MTISIKETKRKVHFKDPAGLVLSASLVFAWLFIVFLSGAFYRGNSSVTSATLFTVAVSLTSLLTAATGLAFLDSDGKKNWTAAYYLCGLALLAAASFLTRISYFRGLEGYFLPLIIGGIAGVGLALVLLSAFMRAAYRAFSNVVGCYLASFALGIVLFVVYAAFVPVDLSGGMSGFLPLLASFVFLLTRKIDPPKNESSNTYARSLAKSQMRSVFENSAFSYFILLAGFLFGYCYNVFPKSTRFAGTYSDAIFGLVSSAAVVFLIVCFLVVFFLVLVGKIARHNSAYVFGCVLLVALAILYSSFPNMPNNWMLFVMLVTAALSAVLFVFAGAIMRFSAGDRKGFAKCILQLLTAVLCGAVVAAIFIETTTLYPTIAIPDSVRDAIIVGTPALGFIVLVMVFFMLARNMFFPTPLERQEEVPGLSDLAAANKILSERFSLTPREEEIMGMLLQGRSGPYISEDLYLSKSTVKTHIRHIYDKVGVSSRQQLIDLAHSVEK